MAECNIKMLFATAKSYLFFSLFSIISSLEKSRGDLEKREEWKEKSEEYKKKKPLARLFFLCKGYKKDILAFLADDFELSHGIKR